MEMVLYQTEQKLELDQENQLEEDVVIKFTHMADDVPRIYSTVVTAYKGNSITKINLKSGELAFLE